MFLHISLSTTIEDIAEPFLQSLAAPQRLVEVFLVQREGLHRPAGNDGGVARRPCEQRNLAEEITWRRA